MSVTKVALHLLVLLPLPLTPPLHLTPSSILLSSSPPRPSLPLLSPSPSPCDESSRRVAINSRSVAEMTASDDFTHRDSRALAPPCRLRVFVAPVPSRKSRPLQLSGSCTFLCWRYRAESPGLHVFVTVWSLRRQQSHTVRL